MKKGTLILIPARAGSKGLPGKNTKLLNGKPLISYSIEFALSIKTENDIICITTNDDKVLAIASEFDNIDIPFKRPEDLSTDTAGSNDVMMHALKHYKDQGVVFESLLLLQATSPFREIEDYTNLKNRYGEGCDMAVTVCESKNNPYFNLFEEEGGFLKKSKESNAHRRQDCPKVFAYNGSMYLINVESLIKSNIQSFTRIIKSVMPEERSIDIDTIIDWNIAEYVLKRKYS